MGALSGSREPSPSSTGLGPLGFDPARDELIHWISANPSGEGNVTACGKQMVFPMRGNGWRVRDITCPECDRNICDRLHAVPTGETPNE
jgi:hypothetical protein